MKKRGIKILAWVLLSACLFMAGQTFMTTAYKAVDRQVNPECLFNGDYASSDDLSNTARLIISELNFWQQDAADKPEFQLKTTLFHYYAAKGGRQITNSPGMGKADFLAEKFHFVMNVRNAVGDGKTDSTFRNVGADPVRDGKIYLSIPKDTIAGMQKTWTQNRIYLEHQLLLLLVWGLASLAFLIFVIAVAGRKAGDDDLHPLGVDKWYTEVFLALLIVLGVVFAYLFSGAFNSYYIFHWEKLTAEAIGFSVVLATGVFLLLLMVMMPLVRKIKAGTFVSGSLLYRLLRRCWIAVKKIVLGIRSFFDGSAYKEHLLTKRLFRSQMVYIVGSAGLLLLCVLLSAASYSAFPIFLFIALELLITWWYVAGNKKAYSEINEGFVESLKEQTKSENTKTALITNVSHDLKTPLTSIITYVDLLSNEEDLSDTARDYVNIIAGKAERLKHIVSDLFDLSKSVSGNIPLDMDVLDLRTLMEQTLADMKDPIENSGHTLKINLGQGTSTIFSDGKKLYRVFQNIIDNALKYSLAGSRIFIDLTSTGDKVKVTVKNTAGYEMNFTEEEILQRFTRGDQARTGDGSGLGLSIAESFTQSCGGAFGLDIDGDQFKVTVEFSTVEMIGREPA